MIHLVTVSAALAFVAVAAGPAVLPSQWHTCKRTLPSTAFKHCLAKVAVEAVQDIAKNGVPTASVHSIEPLEITRLDIGQGDGPVAIELTFKNIKIYGFQGVQILKPMDMQVDVEKMDFRVPVFFSDIRLEGNYKIAGKILVLPVNGEGKTTLTLKNVTGEVQFIGEPFKRKGILYAKVKNLNFDFDPALLTMKFENLFGGNKALSDQMNVFLNENWSEILKELKPAIEEGFGLAFKDTANRIFTKFPYNDIFPK